MVDRIASLRSAGLSRALRRAIATLAQTIRRAPAPSLLPLATFSFDQSLHPRDDRGRFTFTRKPAWQAKAVAFARNHFRGQVVASGVGNVSVALNHKGAKHSLYHHSSEEKAQLLSEVEGAIRRSDAHSRESDKKGRAEIKAVHKITGPAQLNGKPIRLPVVARETNMGVFYYDHYWAKK